MAYSNEKALRKAIESNFLEQYHDEIEIEYTEIDDLINIEIQACDDRIDVLDVHVRDNEELHAELTDFFNRFYGAGINYTFNGLQELKQWNDMEKRIKREAVKKAQYNRFKIA